MGIFDLRIPPTQLDLVFRDLLPRFLSSVG